MKILQEGNTDNFEILSGTEMGFILGGAVDCKHKYINGNVECHKRYTDDDNGNITCMRNYVLITK